MKRHHADGLYRQAAGITGLAEGTLKQFKWMADSFELCSREHELSFSSNIQEHKGTKPDARVKLKAVSEVLGVAHQTVSSWFSSNSIDGKGTKPDARVKLKAVAEYIRGTTV